MIELIVNVMIELIVNISLLVSENVQYGLLDELGKCL